jgi:hypothetical protein
MFPLVKEDIADEDLVLRIARGQATSTGIRM